MSIYIDAVHALRQLTRSNDKGHKLGNISNSLNTIHKTRIGLDYFSVEVTDVTGTQYLIGGIWKRCNRIVFRNVQ